MLIASADCENPFLVMALDRTNALVFILRRNSEPPGGSYRVRQHPKREYMNTLKNVLGVAAATTGLAIAGFAVSPPEGYQPIVPTSGGDYGGW